MKLKLFTFAFDPDRCAFDDAPLQAFLEDKEVLWVNEHFFVSELRHLWSVMVAYRPMGRPGESAEKRPPSHDWRADLSPAEAVVFDVLRSWRGRAARRDGVAPYLVFTNRQLADFARRKPTTISGLMETEGFGEVKARRWGPEIVAAITSIPEGAVASPAPEGSAHGP